MPCAVATRATKLQDEDHVEAIAPLVNPHRTISRPATFHHSPSWRRLRCEATRLLAGAHVPGDAVGAGAPGWSQVVAGPWLAKTLASLRDPEELAHLDPGAALQATLRPYQQAGVRWLHLLSGLGLGACLADDMGLGKTMQVLALPCLGTVLGTLNMLRTSNS